MSKIIRISFFCFGAYTMFNVQSNIIGGAEINLYNLALYFSKNKNYDVSFYVGDYGQKDIETYGSIKVIKFKYLNNESDKSINKFLKIYRLFHQLLKINSDVYITSANSDFLGWLVIANRIMRRRIVIHRIANDNAVRKSIVNEINNKKRLFLYNLGLRKASCIICQSELQKNTLKSDYNINGKVVRNGMIIQESRESLEKEYVLWVGKATINKRPEIFIKLVSLLPEIQFLMIMPLGFDIPHYDKDWIYKTIDSYREKGYPLKNLKYFPYIPFKKIQDYYDKSKLFINTSVVEGFPNSFIQSGIAKSPILSFNVNPDGFIDKYKTGFFVDNDFDKALELIKNTSDETFKILGENNFNYVMKLHNAELAYSEYKKYIESVYGGRTN